MKIPVRQLPHLSSLAYDYFYHFDKIREFFAGDFRDTAAFFEQADKVRDRKLPRKQVADLLQELNVSYGCGDQTIANILKLKQENTCAIVTGQQTGLFSGPLYTIFKALTAVKLAESLNEKNSGFFVPVFWLASDDHDFKEINHIKLLDKEKRKKKISYQWHSPATKIPVSDIAFSKEISGCIQQLDHLMHDSEFKPEILTKLAAAYQPGRSVPDAFARWMTTLFKNYGLIFIDGAHPELKNLGKDVFYTETDQDSPSTQCALDTSKKLAQNNYKTQIQQRQGILNLFLVERERHTIRFANDIFTLKGQNKAFKKEELLQRIEKHPQTFSPNVLLRPLYQDALLPTAAYVGGMSEIAYFAQMKQMYQRFKMPMPVIYPRKSLTLLEKRVDRTLKTYGLKVQDFWGDGSKKRDNLIREDIPDSLRNAFAAAESHIEKEFSEMKHEIVEFDPNLENSCDLAFRKIQYQLEELEKKVLKKYKKRNSITIKRMDLAQNSLYPKHVLQERVFNITPFLIKYGLNLADRLYHEMDLGCRDHQIILL